MVVLCDVYADMSFAYCFEHFQISSTAAGQIVYVKDFVPLMCSERPKRTRQAGGKVFIDDDLQLPSAMCLAKALALSTAAFVT
jgi:hypothetical protein